MDVVDMGARFRLIFLIVLLISLGFYYIINQSNNDGDIDQTIQEEDGTTENDEESNESDEENHVEEEQLQTRVSDIVKDTFEILFTKEFQVVAIGDSLTQGVGDSNRNGGYIGILDETINQQRQIVTFENFGKSGRRTDQLLDVLNDPDIISSIEETDIVLITIGANDIMKVVQQNFTNLTHSLFIEEQVHFEQRLNNIFGKVRAINPNAHIYLLGLYNPFKQYFQEIKELELIVDSWNQTGAKTTTKYQPATFIPIKDLFDETVINLFAEDHFHPNEIGYERMAGRVLEYLTNGE